MRPDRPARRLLRACLLLAALLPCTARAAEWYTVEVLVFERLVPGAVQAEHWRPDPGRPPLEGALELSASPEESAAGSAAGPRAFEALPPESFRMHGIAARFARSGRYRTLLHVAWRQPGFGQRSARAVHLSAGPADALRAPPAGAAAETDAAAVAPAAAPAPAQPALDGTVRVYRARYLHAEVDLLYYRPAAESPQPVRVTGGGEAVQDAGPPVATLFRMQQSRRMRSGELHYLDHPLFGVLIEATPYAPAGAEAAGEEAPPDAEDAGADTAPAGRDD